MRNFLISLIMIISLGTALMADSIPSEFRGDWILMGTTIDGNPVTQKVKEKKVCVVDSISATLNAGTDDEKLLLLKSMTIKNESNGTHYIFKFTSLDYDYCWAVTKVKDKLIMVQYYNYNTQLEDWKEMILVRPTKK